MKHLFTKIIALTLALALAVALAVNGMAADLPGSGTDTATGCTAAEMQDAATFDGFNFTDDWTMGGNADYPYPEVAGTDFGYAGGTLTGSVASGASSAVVKGERATVTAVSRSEPTVTAVVTSTVGETETYAFENLPDGTYTVTVEKPRFAPVTMEITVSGGAATAPAAQLGLWGDVNGDGASTAYDASLILQHNVGLITLSSSQLFVGDVNGDGGTTAYDASLVLQINVGLISVFPVESK